MTLVTILVLTILAAVVVHGADLPGRLRATRVDAELAAMVNAGTADLVTERLSLGPQPVRVRTGRRLHRPFLDIQLDTVRLHLRLYHDARCPAVDGRSLGSMRSLAWVERLGWVATFDGPRGAERYLGWLLEGTGT